MTPIGTEIAGRNAIARDDQVTSIGFIAATRQGGERRGLLLSEERQAEWQIGGRGGIHSLLK